MLNSKAEKVIFLLILISVWLGARFAFRMIPAISQKQVNYLEWGLLIVLWIVWGVAFKRYVRWRDSSVIDKINLYLSSKEYEAGLLYVEKCIKNQKHLTWLKVEKANILALCGHIAEFECLYEELKEADRISENTRFHFTTKLNLIFGFIQHKNIENVEFQGLDDTLISEICVLLKNINDMKAETIIFRAKDIYEKSQSPLYKSISAMILAKTYTEINQSNNSQIYQELAQSYAPSNEIKICIDKYIDDVHGFAENPD